MRFATVSTRRCVHVSRDNVWYSNLIHEPSRGLFHAHQMLVFELAAHEDVTAGKYQDCER